MERYEEQSLDESDQHAPMHDVLHKSVYERVRTRQRRSATNKPTRKLTHLLIPVLEEASMMHIAIVATMSVRAPKPFAKPKKTL